LEGLKIMKSNLFHDKHFNPKYNVLGDLRLSKNNFTIKEVEKYGKWFEEQLKFQSLSLKAILTSTPRQVVQATIFSLKNNLKKNNYEVFSTLEGSLKYLQIDFSHIEIIKIEIKKMKFLPPISTVF